MIARFASRLRPNAIINKQLKNTQKINRIQKRKLGSNWYVEVPENERYTHIGRANPATQSQPLNQWRGFRAQLLFMSPCFIVGGLTFLYQHNTEPIWLDTSLYTYVEKED